MIETRTAAAHAPLPAEPSAPANADPRARARAALAAGRLEDAAGLCDAILAREPDDAEALVLRARIDRSSGDPMQAIERLRRAARQVPEHPAVHLELAGAQLSLGRLPEAAGSAEVAARLAPPDAGSWLAIGSVRYALGDKAGAQDAFARAVALDPSHPKANNNLGLMHLEQGQLKQAAERFERALDVDPNYAVARNNLGTVLDAAGDHAAAEAFFTSASACDVEYLEPRHNLAASLAKRGAWAESARTLEALLVVAPGDHRALWNLGEAKLRLGEFGAGWPLWETGIGTDDYRGPARPFPRKPLGPDATRVLLWGEQGVGEELLFASMLPDLANRGIGGVVECDPRLVPLFARSFRGFRFVAPTNPPAPETMGEFDASMPVASLGAELRGAIADFPRHAGYLRPDRERVAALRARYAADGHDRVVGISWMSGARREAAEKSIDLLAWAPVLCLPGIRFVSLQYGSVARQVEAARAALGVDIVLDPGIDQLRDLDGFAAQVAAMDHVVTISNVAAHLAGALGRPGTVLLPRARGLKWQWLLERPDSPWYPSLALLRQRAQGDWSDPIARAARRVAERRANP